MDNNIKKIFFTSDWHLGHSNVLGFDERPFKDLHHMHRVLVNNYNATVPEDGICYFLGDVGLCNGKLIQDVLAQLNGTKVLVRGNHDKNVNAMYRMGFDVVLYGAVMYIANQRVTMSHCPLTGVYRENTEGMRGADGTENWHGENREKNQRMTFSDEGQFHLHGHIHCLSEDTEILTKSGWKYYNDLTLEDETLTRNITTGKDSWELIKKIIVSDFDGDVYNIKSRYFSQRVTKNHKFLIKDRNSSGYLLSTHDRLPYTLNKYPIVSNIEAKGLDISDDLLKLLIWITADGCFEPNGSGVRFRFKKQRKVDALKTLLTKLNFKFTHCKRTCGVQTLRFNYNKHPDILKFFDVYNKTLPKQLLLSNKQQARIILNEYAITDGCYTNKSKTGVQISTAKEEEADIIQKIMFFNGISCKKSLKKGSTSYLLYVNSNRTLTSVHRDVNCTKENYKGTVWCVQVKNQNFVIRHNGCISFTGNSPNKGKSKRIEGRQMDVGVRANGYAPLSAGSIESWIAKTVQNEDVS